MLSLIRPTLRSVACLATKNIQNNAISNIARNFSQLSIQSKPLNLTNKIASTPTTSIMSLPGFQNCAFNPSVIQVRTVIKFSARKGKRKSVKAVLKRFKRLEWGIWIRTRTARHKRMWKKSQSQRYKSRQHVFVNSTQSTLLDKMVTKFWRRPKYYVDDPYRPYQSRESFWITRKKPIDWNE
ncbi:CLUMA_CG000845, isoform A [Clunio marinus]|uniref:Large ribosomal subunit protein bL35m n=1 Tax=Clunio marinus TaxID=568069 RepID=A0A1J1HGN4_9DIPT|nr:CLUMA_CG000845, isoform A [Clunio marinus]